MAIWYILPNISPSDETDSYVGQYGTGKLRDSWADVTWTNGDSYYQGRGTTHTGGFTITGPTAPITVGAFGTGDRPLVLANGGSYAVRIGAASDVTVQDIEGSGGSTADVGRDTNAGARCVIQRCLSRNSSANVAITSFGDDCEILDCEVYDADNDSISFEGDRVRVAGCTVLGFSISTETGDGISAADAVISTYDCIVENNLVVASKNVKQCLIFNSTSASSGRGRVSGNRLVFAPASVASAAPGQCVYSDFPWMKFVGNEVVDGLFGIYAEAAGIVVIGNVILATAPQALAGVYIGAADISVLNNTFILLADVSQARSDQVAIRHADAGSTHTGVLIQNNAIDNWRYGISRRVVNSTESHNIVNASASFRAFVDQAYSGTSAGTGSSASDPILDARYRLTAASPCREAGTYIAGVRDFSGRKLRRTPDIGARQYFAARSAVSPARSVVAAVRSAESTARSSRSIIL